jgi:hypothetical protein
VSRDRTQILAVLRAQRENIERLYGLRMVGITGSVARGEDGSGSDIDVVVDVVRTPSLFDLSRAERLLEEAIGIETPVDLVLREGLRPPLRARIERDLIPI